MEADHPLPPDPAGPPRGVSYSVSCHLPLQSISQHDGTRPSLAEQKDLTSLQEISRVENNRMRDRSYCLRNALQLRHHCGDELEHWYAPNIFQVRSDLRLQGLLSHLEIGTALY